MDFSKIYTAVVIIQKKNQTVCNLCFFEILYNFPDIKFYKKLLFTEAEKD
jgi:hypothetical protein